MQEIQSIKSYLMDVYGFKEVTYHFPKNRLEHFKSTIYSINNKLGDFLNRLWPIKFLDKPNCELLLSLSIDEYQLFKVRLYRYIICDDSECSPYISCAFSLHCNKSNTTTPIITSEFISNSDEVTRIDNALMSFLSNFPHGSSEGQVKSECRSYMNNIALRRRRNKLLDSIIE